MPISAIVYSSQAVPGLAAAQLEALVQDAIRFNGDVGVTGVLLFDGSRFLQYIEGPQDGVDVVYSRVLHARSHHELMELNRGQLGQRAFPYWSMRQITVDAMCLARVAAGEWRGFVHGRNREDAGVELSAMERLGAVVEQHRTAA